MNLQQYMWMEYLEDYDFQLQYHASKGNRGVDALSRKTSGKPIGTLAHQTMLTLIDYNMQNKTPIILHNIIAYPYLKGRIIE